LSHIKTNKGVSNMPYQKKSKKDTSNKKKNIDGNLRGKEDVFFTKIIKGMKIFLQPANKH